MGNPTSERVVATYTVRGRDFDVTRLTWADTDDLSFDVTDKATGARLHDESFDTMPTKDDVHDLVMELAAQYTKGRFDDDVVDQDRDDLVDMLAVVYPTIVRTVHVVTFEPKGDGGGVGGLDWHPDKAPMDERYEHYLGEGEHFVRQYEMQAPAHLDGDALTEYLDRRLVANDPDVEPTRTNLPVIKVTAFTEGGAEDGPGDVLGITIDGEPYTYERWATASTSGSSIHDADGAHVDADLGGRVCDLVEAVFDAFVQVHYDNLNPYQPLLDAAAARAVAQYNGDPLPAKKMSDQNVIDALATLLGTSPEWDSDDFETIADLLGMVRPHPGSIEGSDYPAAFRAATGREVWGGTDRSEDEGADED